MQGVPQNCAKRARMLCWCACLTGGAASAQVVNESFKFLPGDAIAGDEFGASVAMSGGTCVISAPLADDMGTDSGCARVYVQQGSTWTLEQKIVPDAALASRRLGWSVALDGDRLVLGAPGDDISGASSGAVYVYERSGSTWTQQAIVTPDDARAGLEFGHEVALDGQTLLVGTYRADDRGVRSGTAYVFVDEGGQWSQQTELVPSDSGAEALFGWRLDVRGDIAIVGAPGDDERGPSAGAAYVFTREDTVWTEQAKLIASVTTTGHELGNDVAIGEGLALIGAPRAHLFGVSSGAVHSFIRTGTGKQATWSEHDTLIPANAQSTDFFGFTIALSGASAAIGAPQSDASGERSGAAYLFRLESDAWVEQSMLLPSDGDDRDVFGKDIAMSGNMVLPGASGDDENGVLAGSAYVFVLCAADFNRDGTLNTSDFIAYLNDFVAVTNGQPTTYGSPDLAEPFGVVNTADFIAYLNLFTGGCS